MAVVVLFLLLLTVLLTWESGRFLSYGWQIEPIGSRNNRSLSVAVGHGAFVVFVEDVKNVVVRDASFEIEYHHGWQWLAVKCPKYPYVGTSADGLQFAGFEVCRVSNPRAIPGLTFDRERQAVVCPIWILLLAPLFIIIRNMRKLRSSFRQTGSFPIELLPELPSQTKELPK
jgi:hypothetical protein